jgi:hypothetical protein
MEDMKLFVEALERGNTIRKAQDEVLALFVMQVRNIDDLATLETIKKELFGNG